MLTDRNTLDNQLIQRFNEATNYLQTSPIHIKSRKELSTNLKERKGNGIFFTTIQKLEEETGVLSTRENIYIVCDEAHRSQNSIEDGFKIDDNTIKNKKGFAAFLREAFPNATYIGFTGTPLLGQLKVQTTDIFGDYTDKYLLKQAQEDGTVLKILYENASTDITLPDTLKTEINKLQKEFRESIKDQAEEIRAKKEFDLDKALKSSLILENENVIKIKAEHMMNHYFSRAEVLHGKAMIVASSRLAAYYYYKNIIKLHPEMKEKIILVLSQDNKQLDDEISKAMVPSAKMHEVEEEFKKDNSIYKIVIVCAM
jgi:type I restriction enzyme R subunit